MDDGTLDSAQTDILAIGTLESYLKMADYYGRERVIPLYIEVDDGIRLGRALKREQKPGQGIFGFGKKPSDDICHDRFATDLDTWLGAYYETNPDSKSVREVLTMVYHAPKEHPEPRSAFWMLIAVQGLTKKLIPLLSPADAAALATDYAETYARRERLPAQKQLLDAMQKAAKE